MLLVWPNPASPVGHSTVSLRDLSDSRHAVLVVDVGHDVDNFNTTLPAYEGRVIEGQLFVNLKHVELE